MFALMLSYSYGHIQKIEFNGVNIRLKKFGIKKDPIWDFIQGKMILFGVLLNLFGVKRIRFGVRKNLFPKIIVKYINLNTKP